MGKNSDQSINVEIGTAQKMKFPLRISSANVTTSAGNFGFGHIY